VDIATYLRESDLNRQTYETLRERIRRDFAGQYVAMARGRIVGAATTFDAARRLIEQLDPTPEYYLVFPADVAPDFGLVHDLAGSV